MTEERMTKGEREDLQRLIKQREKVLKSAAKMRSTELLADFESQMAAEYRFDDDVVWAAAAKAAGKEVKKAQEQIEARCKELGIPKQFAPNLTIGWRHRGYENSVKERRQEMRKVAMTQIEVLEQQAFLSIEQASVEAQTQIAVAGLTSEAAQQFAASLPSVESLMPKLSYAELSGESDPPLVEQILTPNALRQRRYRERQTALRNAHVTAAIEGKEQGDGE